MTVEYSLRDASGAVVEMAGPVPQPVRVANIVTVESVAGLNLEQKNHIGGRSMNTLDFANGMPLSPATTQSESLSTAMTLMPHMLISAYTL